MALYRSIAIDDDPLLLDIRMGSSRVPEGLGQTCYHCTVLSMCSMYSPDDFWLPARQPYRGTYELFRFNYLLHCTPSPSSTVHVLYHRALAQKESFHSCSVLACWLSILRLRSIISQTPMYIGDSGKSEAYFKFRSSIFMF